MALLRFSISLLIVIISAIICANCELEEYFKWKQITFASIDQDGDDILFPDSEGKSLRGQRRLQRQYNPQYGGQNMNGQFGGQFSPQFINPQFDQQFNPQQNTQQNTQQNVQQNNQQNSQNYIAHNNVPMGASHYKGRLFLTVPRRRVGVPSTLNFVYTKSTKGSSPSYKAFPNIEMNELHPELQADPNRIISVYRTRVDECNRLWWIDTGLLEYPNNATQVQRPSIWVYDLERDVVVHRFEIPQSVVDRGNGLASITVDVDPNNCQNANGYIPDLAQYRLYVYSLSQNHIWTFRHNYFHFDPLHGDFIIDGIPYQWDDGIFSITLGKRNSDGFRTAYFHPMASTSEFAVSTKVLQNEENAGRSNHGNDFQYLGQRGPMTQSAMHDFDRSGIIFYSQVGRNGVGCWNTNKPHTPQNFHFLTGNNQTMIYPSDLNVDQDGNLWVYTNTMPRFIYSQLNWNEYNFRLWRGNVNDLVRNTPCSDSRGGGYNRS